MDDVLRALAEFATSPGLGGLAAVAAAVIASRAVSRRIRVDRELAAEQRGADAATAAVADARQRWWEVLMWVWDNHGDLGPVGSLDVLAALEKEAHTSEQKAILDGVVQALAEEVDRGPEEAR